MFITEVSDLADRKEVSVLKIVAMYIGAVIGAGFASGQEIMQFFLVHGKDWFREIILVTVLFSYLGVITLLLSVKFKTENYFSLIKELIGYKASKIIDLISILMLMGGLSVMLSGSGAVFSEHLNASRWFGVTLIVIINCLVIMGGLQGVLWINAILVPIKIIAIVCLCLLIININDATGYVFEISTTSIIQRHWLWSGVLYVSYNMVLLLAVLTTLGNNISIKKAVIAGIAGGVGLGVTAGLVCFAGMSLYPEIVNYKVPTLFMAGIISKSLKYPIGILIWLAILTTAIANTHGLSSRLAATGSKKYKFIGIGATMMAIPLAIMDFDQLVGTIYPLFGYAGLFIIGTLLLSPLIIMKKKRAGNKF